MVPYYSCDGPCYYHRFTLLLRLLLRCRRCCRRRVAARDGGIGRGVVVSPRVARTSLENPSRRPHGVAGRSIRILCTQQHLSLLLRTKRYGTDDHHDQNDEGHTRLYVFLLPGDGRQAPPPPRNHHSGPKDGSCQPSDDEGCPRNNDNSSRGSPLWMVKCSNRRCRRRHSRTTGGLVLVFVDLLPCSRSQPKNTSGPPKRRQQRQRQRQRRRRIPCIVARDKVKAGTTSRGWCKPSPDQASQGMARRVSIGDRIAGR